MSLIDAHCHLGTRQFDNNRDEILSRMKEKHVDKVIMICCSEHDLNHALNLKKTHPDFRLAMGIHPQSIGFSDEPVRYEKFRELVLKYKPDMIGEIGLDYHSHKHTRELQKELFVRQMQLAQELNLPVDIHMRRASNDTYEILKQFNVKGIMHSYSGSREMAERFLKLGYYISICSSVLFENAVKPREVIEAVPVNRLLIETDAPYQSPVLNHVHEPGDVTNIYKAIAEIKKLPMIQLEQAVEANFDGVFLHNSI